MKPAVMLMGELGPYGALAVDCFDLRSADRSFTGGQPVVAHPSSRSWGRGRYMRGVQQDERFLCLWVLAQVRRWGGVLVHPANSQLWATAGLPAPGYGCDAVGGWTLPVWQSWFGSAAPKPTWLYIVGHQDEQFPSVPFRLGRQAKPAESCPAPDHQPIPEAMAHWLCGLAQRIGDTQPWRYPSLKHAAA